MKTTQTSPARKDQKISVISTQKDKHSLTETGIGKNSWYKEVWKATLQPERGL